MGPNYGEMVFRWSPFRIISDNPARQRRWWPLLKIDDSQKFAYKFSPLKLLGQWGPNYCEMVINGPLSELCLVSQCNLHARLSPSADIVFT
jgi:hypothetical protein